MAHFAKLGANGKVIQVLTMDNDKMLNADGVEDESVGQQWLETHNNWPAQMWIQTIHHKTNIIQVMTLKHLEETMQA
jgi:glutaredoxin-related protein